MSSFFELDITEQKEAALFLCVSGKSCMHFILATKKKRESKHRPEGQPQVISVRGFPIAINYIV